ncbi:MAG: hypothetical protein WA962_03005 [Ornithinimicrobium sp.]
MSIRTPEAATVVDLATMEVRELIGLLARLEEATWRWPSAVWTGRETMDGVDVNVDVDVDSIVSQQRQVIRELRRRRGA